MARRNGRILPFRIPFFRIFYSTTYTILFVLCLCILAITPTSMIWTAIQHSAYQYIFMLGGVYVLTAIVSIFIYSSRLYTNRTVMAGVGKAYVPVEEGEMGKNVRKMIINQMERSAVVAWECRPRDLDDEKLQAVRQGSVPVEMAGTEQSEYPVGTIISVNPHKPPWGYVQHAGWSSPAHSDDDALPHVQFASVIQELPNLIEARAVSLAPPDPLSTPKGDETMANPAVVELLRRPETMGMRDYLTQLSYLGIFSNPTVVQSFVRQYEMARFSGRPLFEAEFERIMATFSELLSSMTELENDVIEEIRNQLVDDDDSIMSDGSSTTTDSSQVGSMIHHKSSPQRETEDSRGGSPVTARLRPSQAGTPSRSNNQPSQESFNSVIHRVPTESVEDQDSISSSTTGSGPRSSSVSLASETGSVIHNSA